MMKLDMTLIAAGMLALAAARPAGAQDRAPSDDDTPRVARPRATPNATATNSDPRALLGLALSFSGAERDTLGALVTAVVPNGPAERAGIDAGNRIASLNGVSLRVDAESVGENGAGDALLRRVTRSLGAVQPGDEVEVRVFSAGRFRTLTLETAGATAPRVLNAPSHSESRSESRNDAADDAATPAAGSVAGMVDAVASIQAQLRKMEAAEGAGPTLDSLTALEQDLGAIRRRLRTLQTKQDRATTHASSGTSESLPGLSVSSVADELVPVLGEGSESGLLVLKADNSWDPIRPGDVILRVNGAPATIDRLGTAHTSSRASTIDVLRRKHELSVVLDPGDAR